MYNTGIISINTNNINREIFKQTGVLILSCKAGGGTFNTGGGVVQNVKAGGEQHNKILIEGSRRGEHRGSPKSPCLFFEWRNL